MRRILWAPAALALVIALSSCSGTGESAPKSIAVFVPGVVSGSPTYEQLVAGATKAVAATKGATIKVIEAGFNQSEWQDRLSAVAASGQFGLIVTSNPSLPELCAKVALDFPKVKFFVADAWMSGNPAIHTVLYNQFEQAWIVGYLAGLLTTMETGGRRPAGMAAMVIAQRYPSLDKLIEPGFRAGLLAANPKAGFETRIIGNWYDAAKAAELAKALYSSGVEVILPIAGGAGQGVLSAATEAKRRVLWFDGSGYDLAPGVVVGSAIVRQDRLVAERVGQILAGKGSALFGKADIVNAAQGYVDFDESGAAYKALPEDLRASFEAKLTSLRRGALAFPVSGL